MKLGQSLVDKASKACGSDASLARAIGIYPADVCNLRSGKRPLSPELAAELADIAGDDARQAVIDAVIERNKGTRKERVLKDILGKALAAGVVGLLAISYNSGSTFDIQTSAMTNQELTALYIVLSQMLVTLRRRHRTRENHKAIAIKARSSPTGVHTPRPAIINTTKQPHKTSC